MPWNMCGSQVVYGMLGRLEHEDLGALISPRPLLIETGTEDPLFPLAAATESVRHTRLVYAHDGAADRLEHDIFEGDHQWHGVAAVPFLNRWLSHTPEHGLNLGRAAVRSTGARVVGLPACTIPSPSTWPRPPRRSGSW